MAITTTGDQDFDVQILTEEIQGHFAGKTAFIGSPLVSGGAVLISDTFAEGEPDRIGETVTVPYFGNIGSFTNNPDGSSVTPSKIKQRSETATVARGSLAFEVSRWARGAAMRGEDPYKEASRQIGISAQRYMDSALITAAETSPLLLDRYSASSPNYLDWDTITDARAKWGDENGDIVGMIVHSRTEADLRKLRDENGRPLLVDSMRDGEFPRFQGVPLILSDRAPLTGSTMSPTAMIESGTLSNVDVSGTPLGAWNLKILITDTGALGVSQFKFSVDGGQSYSGKLTTGASVPLIDPDTDSTIGVNGATGLTAAFTAGGNTANDFYTSNAIVKVQSMLIQKGALAFWFNRKALGLETDKDILAHTDVAAMHLYHAAHLYRRRNGGKVPGVVRITHNVRGFTTAAS
jgi:hypothetical protein